MPRRRAGRRAVQGLALGLLVPLGLGGCRWLPARRPPTSLDPREVSRAGPRADGPPLPAVARTTAQEGVPLPPLPLQPVSDAEALALAPPPRPTPGLDAALEEARAMEAAVLTSFEEPAPSPPAPLVLPDAPSPPTDAATADTGPPADSPKDEAVQLATLPAEPAASTPDPAPAEPAPAGPEASAAKAIDPEASWHEGLERLLGLAREQAQGEPAPGGMWASREQVLARLAESRGGEDDPARVLWQAMLDALAEAEAREPAAAEPPVEAPDPETSGQGTAAGEAPVELTIPDEPAPEIVELQLCRKVDGFGLFEPAGADEVRPGRTLTLYWEVEGLRAESDGPWFRTRLSSSAEILPADGGEPVWRKSLGTAEDACRRPRRDYFVNGRITLPDDLHPGSYQLRLSLDDLVSGRSATRTLPFTIQP